MKADNEVIGAVVVFFLGAAFGAIMDEKSFNSVYTAIFPAITTLFAAFLGAKYAFSLQERNNEKKLIDHKVAAGNKAIFALVRKHNKLKNFQMQSLDPYRNDPTAFLQILPVLEMKRDDILLDIDSISFLLETDQRNLLGEITIGIAKYLSAIDAINARSQLHLNEIQPLVDRSGIMQGGNCTLVQIESVIGPRLFASLKQVTDDTFELTDGSLVFIEKIALKLTCALKETFSGKAIISLQTLQQQKEQ